MDSIEPEVVLEDGDLVVLYRVVGAWCLLTIFSQDDKHNLAAALGAIRLIAQGARVRYQPVQNRKADHILVEYGGELREQNRGMLASTFVAAIKRFGKRS